MKIVPAVVFAIALLSVPTRAELYTCGSEGGCPATINEDGQPRVEKFRKGDTVDTEAGWYVSTDDGWNKVKSGLSGNAMGPAGNVTSLPATAGLGVAGGSRWMWGNQIVTARVQDPRYGEPTDVTAGITDRSGASPNVPGSGGPESTPDAPTCDDSDVITTPDGTKYRYKGDKVQRLNPRSGQWVNGTLIQTPQSAGGAMH